jgi:hypothetical protein
MITDWFVHKEKNRNIITGIDKFGTLGDIAYCEEWNEAVIMSQSQNMLLLLESISNNSKSFDSLTAEQQGQLNAIIQKINRLWGIEDI